jgi:hypothetical protein
MAMSSGVTWEPLKDPVLRVLSWGAGLQSTTLAVMSALGELEKLDYVLFADTGNERQATYQIVEWYTPWLEARGINVEIIRGGNIIKQGMEEHVHIPFWSATGGPLKRQCTRNFKIRPIKRRIRELMGYHRSVPPNPQGQVEQWIGFSWDEAERMKGSEVAYLVKRHPLLEKRMTRADCTKRLQDHGLPVPIKSACVICPYRQASEWVEMREEVPAEFDQAVAFDEQNRHNPLAARGAKSMADALYIYKRAVPLATADLEADAARERGGKQLPLMMCGGPCAT